MNIAIVKVPCQVVHEFWFLIDVIVYKTLENRGHIHEAKCHDVELEWAFWGVKGSEPFLSFLDTKLVVSGLHVKLQKDFGSSDLVHDLIEAGEG